jgi:hypothetical protein
MIEEKQIQRRVTAFLIPTRSRKISRQRSSSVGTYRTDITIELCRQFPDRFITPHEIAKVQYGRPRKENVGYVKRILWKTYTALQASGILWYPVYNAARHGELAGIKPYLNDDVDKTAFPHYLKRVTEKQETITVNYNTLTALKEAIDNGNEQTTNTPPPGNLNAGTEQ